MIKSLFEKYSILRYILVSLFTAIIETAIGLLFINVFSFSEVVSNTIGIIIGSAVHYLLITEKVFSSTVNIRTVIIYLSTFVLGVVIQNSVVWGVCKILNGLFDKNIVYILAKGTSLVVSFLVMYQLRKIMYRKVSKKEINQ